MQSTWNASVGSSSRKSSIASCSYDTTDVHKTETKQIYEEYFPELFTY